MHDSDELQYILTAVVGLNTYLCISHSDKERHIIFQVRADREPSDTRGSTLDTVRVGVKEGVTTGNRLRLGCVHAAPPSDNQRSDCV